MIITVTLLWLIESGMSDLHMGYLALTFIMDVTIAGVVGNGA